MVSAQVETAVALRAAGQHGLIARRHALSLGLTPRMIDNKLARGTLIPVARGLYRIAGAPVTWEQRVLAACLLGGPGSVASHKSAGALWRLSGVRPGRPEVTVTRNANADAAAQVGTVHSSRRLVRSDVTRVNRIPVTKPIRTVIDLGARITVEDLTDVVDDMVCRRLATIEQLVKGASRLSHQPGVAKLALVLAQWRPGPRPDSVAEMQVERCLIERGIPPPVRQHEVRINESCRARLDLAWPDQRVGLELQSLRHHGSPDQFHADRRRILELRSLGWDVLEVTPRLLAEDQGARMCRAVARTLTRSLLDIEMPDLP